MKLIDYKTRDTIFNLKKNFGADVKKCYKVMF